MTFNKKILSFFLVLVMVFAFVACSNITTTTNNPTTSSTTSIPTSAPTTSFTTETTTTTTEVTTATIESTTQTTISTLHTTEATETTFTSSTESVIIYTSLELVSNNKRFYRLNDTFDKESLELVVHLSDGSSEYVNANEISVRSFNSNTAGEKTIFIIFDKFLLETKVIILESYAFEIHMDYYQDTINLRGNTLKVVLNRIMNEGFINLLYGDARDILQESDVDPNNPNNLIQVYLGNSVKKTWDGGTTWNREHVWPQSRLGVGVGYGDEDFPSKATDIHNLKPADPDENAFRSNDYFDWFGTSNTYVPRDEVKGDIARILFYMATMYFDLTLNDNPYSLSSLKSMGILSVLLEWNEMDPVDDFERNRNEVIYFYQGNRNPFIDYPEFANLIWGDLAS